MICINVNVAGYFHGFAGDILKAEPFRAVQGFGGGHGIIAAGADAYDAVYVIKAAVEKAGSTSGDALAAAMTSLTVEGVTGTMTWGSDGNTNKPASAILYYDGVGTLFDSQD